MTTATDILDALDRTAKGQTDVSVGDVIEKIGHRGTGALLVVPATLELTPVGGIPGVPTILAMIIALFAVQIVFGRSHMWLPGFLEQRSADADKLTTAVEKLRPAARWSDRHLGKHITVLVDPPAPRFAALAVITLCATVPALELVPFASSIPMGTVVLFGIAILVRDGRVMALGWLAFAVSVGAIWSFWP